jgi:hypothetical protein
MAWADRVKTTAEDISRALGHQAQVQAQTPGRSRPA